MAAAQLHPTLLLLLLLLNQAQARQTLQAAVTG
jgi:hypothetical protein